MYLAHWQLNEKPFSITPDPRYLFLSERHREALAHLLYGAGEAGGFVQLTGEVGTGKTMTCRAFLAQLPEQVDAALVLNPAVTARELLRTILDELEIPRPEESDSTKALVDALNHHLLDAHRRGRCTVVLIDEAQNLGSDVLEQVRLLTNLETEQHKLLQIFLVGQPELRAMLGQPQLRQVAQRITARYHLDPLRFAETCAYVEHRLRVAGAGRPLFTRGALRQIHRYSRGVPRLINIVADRALLAGYATGRQQVSAWLVRRAVVELKGRSPARVRLKAAAIVVGAVGIGAWGNQSEQVQSALAAGLTQWLPVAVDPRPPVRHPTEPAKPTEPVAPAPVLPAYVQIQERLRAEPKSADRALAEAALLERWGMPPSEAADLCGAAENSGLRCFEGRGDWEELRLLDRPAIIVFRDGATPRYALVTTLDDRSVTVRVGSEEERLERTELDAFWRGYYQLLWRPPQSDTFIIGEGAAAGSIGWLRQALGMPADAAPRYDRALRAAVRRFQVEHGLAPDGVAGPRTLIHLNNRIAAGDIPRLSVAPGG